MAQPTPYNRVVNFQDLQALSPSTPLPGQSLDSEFNSIINTFNQTLANLALIQRDDGELANQTVGFDQLKGELFAGINPATLWATATAYVVDDVVINLTSIYRCIESHTSGTFSSDLSTGYWELLMDLSAELTVTGITGDLTVDSNGVATIAGNAVDRGMMAQGSARSVIGVTGNSAANVADIVGTTDQVFRINGAGTALAFGSIDLSKAAAVGSSLLAVVNGGTGADDAATARTNLGLGTAAVAALSNDVTLGDDSETDAVTEHAVKSYVDTQIATGAVDLTPVEAATTANGALATAYENGDTVDGVVLVTGDRILLKNQTAASENGVYVVAASGAPTRATDNDESDEFVGRQVLVLGGTANASTKWKVTNTAAPTVNTTDIGWVQTQAANSYSAGTGLTLTGQEFTVDGTVVAKKDQVNIFAENVQRADRTNTDATSVAVGATLGNATVGAISGWSAYNASDTGTRAALQILQGTSSIFAAAIWAERTGTLTGRVGIAKRAGTSNYRLDAEIDESGNLEILGGLESGDAPLTWSNHGSIPHFATTTAAAAADISAYSRIYVEGYAALGDGGHGHWRNVSTSEPAHTAKFQDAGLDWWEPDEEIINTKMIGMKLDDSTDDRTAWETVISMINDNTYKNFFLPEGTSRVSAGALTAITKSFWSIESRNPRGCVIKKTGTTNGHVFIFGDASTTASQWRLKNIEIDHGLLSGTPGGNAFWLKNCSGVVMEDIRMSSVATGIRLGSTDDATDVRQSQFEKIRIDLEVATGSTFNAGIEDQGSSAIYISDTYITASGGGTNANTHGIWIHPGLDQASDSWRVVNTEVNLTNANCGYSLYIDGTQSSASNKHFVNCTFDRAESAGIFLSIAAGISAASSHNVSNIHLIGCGSNAANTGASLAPCILADNRASDGSYISFHAIGCNFTTNNADMIRFAGAGGKQVVISGSKFATRADVHASVDACITGLSVAVYGTIIGNIVAQGIDETGATNTPPEYFLDNGSITNLKALASVNDVAACSGGFQQP